MQNEEVRVVSSFRNAAGQPCQIIEQTVRLSGGERVRATGMMCRQRDGRWTLMR
jgi:surface antigen